MMSRGNTGRQMKAGLGQVDTDTTSPDASSEKMRTGRDKDVPGSEPEVMGAAMQGGDQTMHKNTMGDGSCNYGAKNVQQ